MIIRPYLFVVAVLLLALFGPVSAGAAENTAPKPLHALLVTGGCCHDYEKQKKVLTEGVSARANVQWTIVHEGGGGTQHKVSVYKQPEWWKPYDVVVHDECFSDEKDPAFVDGILKAHREGKVPAVNLHCGMHSYRTEGFPGDTPWFEFTGLSTSSHGPQEPIAVSYVDKDHPITKGLENWTTINEELYNNLKVWPKSHVLARGKQGAEDAVVAWTNDYHGTRVFSTTLGHNTETVADKRYLDLVTRGLLWSVDKLDDKHLKPAEKVLFGAAAGKKVLVPEDLARGKPATASASQAGHDPAHATDGDSSTRWCAADDQPGYWWQVDLGKPQDLTGCRINWEQDGVPYRYTVEGSADGKNWTNLADQTKSGIATQVRTEKFDAFDLQFVRITVTGMRPGAWASFWDVEIFGTKMVETTLAGLPLQSVAARDDKERSILAGTKAPPGFDVTVFAAPPDVNYPTCLAAAPNGEVFVGVDPNGSLDAQSGRGKIVRCVDADNDGRADAFNVFADNVDSPRGLFYEAATATLYVQHPPFVRAFHDDDRDGTADRNEVLVDGLGFDLKFRGADHTTNGMQMGIDGYLYIAVGDYGFIKATGRDGKSLQLLGGGVVRVRPDGTGLEIVSRGQRNIYDVAVSPTLDLFTRDNTNDGDGWDVRLSHVIPTGHYGYPTLFKNFPDEIVQPLADYGGGSPCGSLFLDEPWAFPQEFGSTLYTCDWGRNVVYRHPLTENGAGFKAEQSPFVEMPRPVDMDADGQGRLYLASWRNGGFNYSGPDVGHVIRVTSAGNCCPPPPAFPDLANVSDDGLLKQLASPSHVMRLQTQREILRRGDSAAARDGLKKLAASGDLLPARVAALYTLAQLRGALAEEDLLRLAADDDLREFALRAGRVMPDALLAAVADPDPRVRLAAVTGLGTIGRDPKAAGFLLPLTGDPDPLVAHAAVHALVANGAVDECFGVLDHKPSEAGGALRVLRSIHDPRVVDGLVRRLEAARDPALRRGILTALCRLYYREAEYAGDWWGTRPDTRGPYYKPTRWEQTDRIDGALKSALAGADADTAKFLVAEFQRHRIESDDATQLLLKLAGEDPSFTNTAVELLSGRATLPAGGMPLLVAAFASDGNPPALRAKALAALHRASHDATARDFAVRALATSIHSDLPGDVSRARDEFLRDGRHTQKEHVDAFVKLAAGGDAPQREVALAVLLHVATNHQAPKESRDVASQAIERAWAGPESAAALLRAVGRWRSEPYAYQVRAHLKDERPAVREAAEVAAKLIGLDSQSAPSAGKVVIGALPYEQAAAAALADAGDAKLGAQLFTRQGCVACHTVAPSEPPKGPYLGDVAVRYGKAELIESVLQPNAKIAQGFVTHWFVTKGKKRHDGFIVREGGDEIEIRNVAGISTVLKTTEIAKRGVAEGSVMPQGMADALSPQELASLLAYLQSLKGN